jgi:hypothetical protein
LCNLGRRLAYATRASSGAVEEQFALAGVARERCRALELCSRFLEAAELGEKVGREASNEARRLDPLGCVNRAMGIGSRHTYLSHHLRSLRAGSRHATTGASRPAWPPVR